MKIVFFGSGTYTIPIIEMLLQHGLSLIVTTEKEGAYINFLKKLPVPFLMTNLKSPEDIKTIEAIGADVAVLASYGAIIPQHVLDLFPHGILNVHPSLLPLQRGPSPIQSTILAGDTKTAVTIIKLDHKVDHGPILLQKEVELVGTETGKQLKKDLFAKGAALIEHLIIKLEKGEKIEEHEQNHEQATFTKKIKRESGYIDVEDVPEKDLLTRMIRAYYPWPGVWTEYILMGKKKRIKLLPEDKIQVEGKNAMTYKDFVNGYGKEGRELVVKLGLV